MCVDTNGINSANACQVLLKSNTATLARVHGCHTTFNSDMANALWQV